MQPTEDAANWLATAGKHAVPLGPTVVSAVSLDDSNLDEFLAMARRIRDAGLVAWVGRRPALRRDQKIDYPADWRDLGCVVETVGDCAALPVSVIDGSIELDDFWSERSYSIQPRFPPFPCLIGAISTIRYLASCADDPPPDQLICRSQKIRTDFLAYSNLWTGADSSESAEDLYRRVFESKNARGRFAWGIGEVLAYGHQNGVLYADAHERNFGLQRNGKIAILDTTHPIKILYRPPSPAQCATDIAPLLDTFSPADWRAFRFGYLYHWRQGLRVIDYIEYGDIKGWMNAVGTNDFTQAVKLLDQALAECPTHATAEQAAERMVILTARAYACNRLGRHSEAYQNIKVAIEIASLLTPPIVPLLALHMAFIHLRAGESDEALPILRAVASMKNMTEVRNIAKKALSSILSQGKSSPDLSVDLPLLVRHGRGTAIMQLSSSRQFWAS